MSVPEASTYLAEGFEAASLKVAQLRYVFICSDLAHLKPNQIPPDQASRTGQCTTDAAHLLSATAR